MDVGAVFEGRLVNADDDDDSDEYGDLADIVAAVAVGRDDRNNPADDVGVVSFGTYELIGMVDGIWERPTDDGDVEDDEIDDGGNDEGGKSYRVEDRALEGRVKSGVM